VNLKFLRLDVVSLERSTGDIERFSPQENLKGQPLYSGFSLDKNNNQIKQSQRASPEPSESDFKNFDKTL